LDSPCKICGPNRLHSWSSFEYEGTEVDEMHVSDNPLGDFVHWILTNFLVEKKKKKKKQREQQSEEEKKQVETLVYSHFGGEFYLIKIMVI
jgi:hypothetical protein